MNNHDGPHVQFLMWLPDGAGTARFQSGGHQFEAELTRDHEALRVVFPLYNSEITARAQGSGLVGRMTFFTTFNGRVDLTFSAAPVRAGTLDQLRPPHHVSPAWSLAATQSFWRVELAEGGTGKLTLREVSAGVFEATLARDTGGLDALAGFATDHGIVLGGFDGVSAYLLELSLSTDLQQATGSWIAGQALDWRQSVQLQRTDDFVLSPRVALEPVGTAVELPQLAPFAGKPVVVEIGGSWCTGCRSIAPTMNALYREFHPRGVEMVTLLYELTDDVAYGLQQATKFKHAYDIPWPVVAVPGELGQVHIPGVGDNSTPFPLVLFLTSAHTIAAIHVGWPGDAAKLGRELGAHVEQLLQR